MIAKPAAQVEDDLYTGEVAGRVLDRAVGRVVAGNIQLWQLDLRIHHQRICQVPDKNQVLRCVRHCKYIW